MLIVCMSMGEEVGVVFLFGVCVLVGYVFFFFVGVCQDLMMGVGFV